MNKRIIGAIAASWVLLGSASWLLAGGAGTATFTAEAYIEHVKYLASDELRGRRPGSDGMAKAEVYIANHFAKLGLKPMGDDDSFFQSFELRREKRFDAAKASFELVGSDQKFAPETDWTTLPMSTGGSIGETAVAFAGYGIDAKDDGYTDYDGFDPSGKVLLMLRYEPQSADKDAKIGGSSPSPNATFQRKVSIAADKGAKAILLVNPPLRKDDDGKEVPDKLMPFSLDEGRGARLPFLHISQKMADAILESAKMPPLRELQSKLDTERKGISADLPAVKVKFDTGIRYAKARNVIAMLEGTSAKDEYVVVGGHHDHLGFVSKQFGMGSGGKAEIHNGADDNASGASGVLELARVISQGPRPRRSIIFMTFSAEEMGLLGSAHFVKQPTVPLDKIVAMVNFDMIGRLGQDDFTIYGTDTADEFAELVRKYAEPLGIKYSTPTIKSMSFGDSDHSSFFHKGIPVLFPFTGLHKQYHKPEDDWERIDAEGAAKVLSLFAPVIVDVANLEGGPTVTMTKKSDKPTEAAKADAQPAEAKADTAKADAPVDRPSRSDTPMPRVRLGIAPSYNDAGPGLLIESVVEGGAAASGGVKDGDRIRKIDGKDIGDLQDYMSVMRAFKPGDEITITLERGKETKELKVKLPTAPAEPKKPS